LLKSLNSNRLGPGGKLVTCTRNRADVDILVSLSPKFGTPKNVTLPRVPTIVKVNIVWDHSTGGPGADHRYQCQDKTDPQAGFTCGEVFDSYGAGVAGKGENQSLYCAGLYGTSFVTIDGVRARTPEGWPINMGGRAVCK